jgi:hypothetical protein
MKFTLKLIYDDFSKKSKLSGVIAIVDSDFDKITKKSVFQHPCLFRTDYHDIELMMLRSGAFNKFFKRYCTEINKLKHYLEKFYKRKIREENLIQCFLEALLKNSKKLGISRWINFENRCNLSFKNLNYFIIMDKELFNIDGNQLINHIITKNHKNREFKKKFKELHELELTKDFNLNQICQGHDTISILAIWINNLFCKRKSFSSLQPEDIQKFLEGSYEFRFFKESKLYQDLISWQQENPKLRIFNN